MCWACEEQALWWRYQLEVAVAQGVIPEGFMPADFELAGLPVPGSADAAALLAVQTGADVTAPTGTPAAGHANETTNVPRESRAIPAKRSSTSAEAFVCEPADGE